MAVFETEKFGKRKAEDGIQDGEPSTLPSFSSFLRVNRYAEVAAAAEVGLQDPLVVFGSEIMKTILCKLDARSVALACSVSAGWLALASADEIWAPKRVWYREWSSNSIISSATSSIGNSPSWEAMHGQSAIMRSDHLRII